MFMYLFLILLLLLTVIDKCANLQRVSQLAIVK